MRFGLLSVWWCAGFLAPLAFCADAKKVEAKIEAILQSSAIARAVHWGIQIVDLETGRIVFQRNADKFFIPASNTKLFSSALALSRLGPDHRQSTTVLVAASPDKAGVVGGDLRLVGGGDPNLSDRQIPYKKDGTAGEPHGIIEALADKVIGRGVRRIDGDILGDDSAYCWEPYPDGWAVADAVWEYGAGVSALALTDGSLRMTIRPAKEAGSPAIIQLRPPFPDLAIHNRTITVPGGVTKLSIDRLPGSSELVVSGSILANEIDKKFIVAVPDPALYAAQVFRSALQRRGVAISGRARALHRAEPCASGTPAPPGIELASHSSAALIEQLRVINKVSQNLHAEMVLLEVARMRTAVPGRQSGLDELKSFLAEVGVGERDVHFEDGSGLSRLTRVTPAVVMKLLLHMHRSPLRTHWLSVFPVGGEDGTLSDRFKGVGRGSVQAKTGTISHVSALSGYAMGARRQFAFSIIANNYNSESSAARALIDKIAGTLVERR